MEAAAAVTAEETKAVTITSELPTIDIGPLLSDAQTEEANAARDKVAEEIFHACTEYGFFYIKNHGVSQQLEELIDRAARAFFSQPLQQKRRTVMERGGRAWRGYFQVGDELTSGKPDLKEGLYFGTHQTSGSAVEKRLPMHGPNLHTASGPFAEGITSVNAELHAEGLADIAPMFTTDADAPAEVREAFREYLARHTTENDRILADAVEQWIDQMRSLGHKLMEGIARSLHLPPHYFKDNFMRDPLCLFRIFNYPNPTPLQALFERTGTVKEGQALLTISQANNPAARPKLWSVGEHTDYGMITILRQDNSGGLQVRRVPKLKEGASSASDEEWIEAPPIPGTFVINIGDMLEKMTGGVYLSTPHRVLNPTSKDRISFPFFFDPDFNAKMTSLVTESPRLQALLCSDGGDGTSSKPASLAGRAFRRRWDGKEVGLTSFDGTYGEYIISKVSKVFPHLVAGRID